MDGSEDGSGSPSTTEDDQDQQDGKYNPHRFCKIDKCTVIFETCMYLTVEHKLFNCTYIIVHECILGVEEMWTTICVMIL